MIIISTIADLMIHMGCDTRDLESGFDRAGRAVGSMTKIVMAATAAGAAAIGAAAKFGIEYNSQMENYTTNFKVMLGDQESAVAKMQELKDMAASTPFELSGLADATQTLLAFQVPASETTDILSMLGDVSLGNSQKLASLATVFGQVSSAGKLTGQDLAQFINSGFNPLNYIAQRTGESMEDLRDRMSEGKVTIEEVTQAFQDATSAGGQFFNGMEEASHTMTGLISTLKDNARSLVGEVFEPISESIAGTLLPQAIGYIDDLTEAFREKGVEGLVEAAGEVLSSVVTTIAEGAPQFAEIAVSLVESLLDGLIENIPAIVDGAVGIVTELVKGIINMLPKVAEAGVEILVSLYNGIAEALPELIPAAIDAVIMIVETILNNVDRVIEAGQQIWYALMDGIMQAVPKLIDALPNIIGELVAGLLTYADALIETGVTLFVSLVSNLPAIINGILEAIPEIVDNITKTLTSKENQDKMGEAGKTLLSSFWDNIWTGFQEDWQKFLADPWGGPGSKTYAEAMNPTMPTGGGGVSAGSFGGRTGREDDAKAWQTVFNNAMSSGKTQSEAEQIATNEIYGDPGVAKIGYTITPKGYATGGYPESGDLFYANEGGEPEYVGRVGNRTAVANSSNMEDAVATGNREVVSLLQQMLDKLDRLGGDVYIDGDRMAQKLSAPLSRREIVSGRSLA